jgi:hypothetical protein
MTIAPITSRESEVIAFHTIFFCHGVGYKIGRKMRMTLAGCNEKARHETRHPPPGAPANITPALYLNGYKARMSDL